MRYAASLNLYDFLPYPSAPLPRTHPHYLGGLSLVHGLAAPERTRILDIGCGSGRNLAWISATIPEAECCVGVDLAGGAIADAREFASILDARVDFRVSDFAGATGSFDCIIANGLYSWVDSATRARLLTFIDEHLSLDGIAYVSFHEEHRPWREELLGAEPDPMARLRIVKQRYPSEFEDMEDGLIFHDAVAEISDAISIAEFEAALPPGLMRLCDARPEPESHFHEAVLVRSGRQPEDLRDRIWWVTEESFPATVRHADPADAIEALSHARPLVHRASDHPLAWKPARLQAERVGGSEVINYFGALVELDEADRALLMTLDGSRRVDEKESIKFFARAGLLVG